MADIKWIKLTTDMFDNRKIKHLRKLPEGNSIVLIWVMLLTMAGRCNAGGMIFLTENIPYTPKMLADELGFEENTVVLALQALENFSMIVSNQGYFTISGWEEYQNIEGMDKIREQTRKRVAQYRENQKQLVGNVTCNVTVTQCNAAEEDKEEEKELEEDKRTEYRQVVDLYHSICKSFPKIRSLSDARKKAIKARLKTYSLEDFKTVFEKAESSSFLKGEEKDWSATFDWLIKEANFLKVLEGNYADKKKRKEVVPGWMNKPYEYGDAELEAIKRIMAEPDDPELEEELQRKRQEVQDRAEKLRQSLGVGV